MAMDRSSTGLQVPLVITPAFFPSWKTSKPWRGMRLDSMTSPTSRRPGAPAAFKADCPMNSGLSRSTANVRPASSGVVASSRSLP